MGLAVLLPEFGGRSKAVWGVALLIRVWHHFEDALLLYQAQAGQNLFETAVPTSIYNWCGPGRSSTSSTTGC